VNVVLIVCYRLVSLAPTARKVIAQGNALGNQALLVEALKARKETFGTGQGFASFALSALKSSYCFNPGRCPGLLPFAPLALYRLPPR
jgi:hypothetical protein